MNPILGKLFGKAGKNIVDAVGTTLDNLITSKEEKEQAKLAITQEVNRHLEAVQDDANKEVELFLADKQNARGMQITALGQDDKFSKRFVYYLASFIIVSATGFGFMFFFVEFPESNRRIIEMFVDIYLFAGAIMVLQFFFGSSSSSKEKDQTIKNLKG